MLVLPVVSKFNPSEIAVAGREDAMRKHLSGETSFYTYLDLFYKSSGMVWLIKVLRLRKQINAALDGIIRTHNLKESFKFEVTNVLFSATRYFESCRKIFSHSKPKVVITEYGKNFYNAIMITAAKSIGIPTYTLIHGTINDKNGYFPFNAEKIFCWGERQKNLINSWGVDKKNIIVAGNQKINIEKLDTGEIAKIKKRLKLDKNKTLITLTPNPIPIGERQKLAGMFCEASSDERLSEFEFCIKLHPSDAKSNYEFVTQKYKNVKIIGSDEVSFKEIMNITEHFVVHNSSIGIEALLFGKRLTALDVLDIPLYNIKELVDEGLSDIAVSAAELIQKIMNPLITDEKKKEKYLKQYYERTGDKAAEFIYKELEKIS